MKVGSKKVIGGKEYYIERLIGKGSFKKAFLAYTQDGTQYVIFKQVSKTKESTNSFMEEIKTMENFYKKTNGQCFPNIICPVYIQKPSLFKSGVIITNYIPGIDLSEFINEQRYSKTAITRIVFNLLKALDTLHDKIGYVHLDLKPSNIRINPNTYEVGIIDIGMGCDVTEEKCQQVIAKGTLMYMAPELFSLQTSRFDIKLIDIWAMGCIIFELVYKKPLLLCMTDGYPDYMDLYRYYRPGNGDQVQNDVQKCIYKSKDKDIQYILNLIEMMLQYDQFNRAGVNYLLYTFFDEQTGGKSQYYGRRSKVMVKVPKNVRRWAENAFKLKHLGFKGALETGWKRAKQLSENESIPIEDLRYMRNWYARHRYTSYPGFKDWVDAGKPLDKSWHNKHAILSWITWGGDPGFHWVNSDKTINLLNKHFNKNYKKIKEIK